MPATATVTPARLVPALHAFIAQRSGIDPRMYGGSREVFMGDYRPMIQAGKDARVMLAYVSRSHTITPAMWADALSTTDRFDWNDDTAQLDYTTGQFFGVEYRPAVCRLLASLFFEWSRDEAGRVDSDKLRTFARREFGRGLASRWFR